MTANGSLERRLTEHYTHEPPLRAPDRVLLGALASIDTTPQRRGSLAPWRSHTMNTYARLAAAIVVAVAVGAVGFALISRPGGPGATPSPSTSVTSSPAISPASTSAPTPGSSPVGSGPPTAADFVPRFSYVLPEQLEFQVVEGSATYFEARVPAWHEAGHPGGIIVQAIGGRHIDPCDRTSTVLPLVGVGGISVFDHLRLAAGVSVTNEATVTVDSSYAREATVVATPVPDCLELWPWQNSTEPFIAGPVLRLIVLSVRERMVVITVFGEPDNPGWPAMADEIIASFRFQRGPSPS